MHHYVGATTMLIESGAEMRGRMTREPVSALTLPSGRGPTAVCVYSTAELLNAAYSTSGMSCPVEVLSQPRSGVYHT